MSIYGRKWKSRRGMLCFIEGLNCSSFGTKHGAAPLGPKHYRTELETLVYLFQTASLSLSNFGCLPLSFHLWIWLLGWWWWWGGVLIFCCGVARLVLFLFSVEILITCVPNDHALVVRLIWRWEINGKNKFNGGRTHGLIVSKQQQEKVK